MNNNKQVLIADSTQITRFLECPQLWQYSSLENLTRYDAAQKTAMLKGTYGHKLLEIYYSTLCNPALAKFARDYSMDWVPEMDTCECGHLKTGHEGILIPLGYINACQTPDCECQGFKAAAYPLGAEDIQAVKDRFWYYTIIHEQKQDDIVPLSADSVEVGFSEQIYEDENYLFILEGKIDVIGTMQRQKVIMDHKFQDRQSTLYKKALQFKNYCLVAEVDTLVVNYIRMMKAIDEFTFVRDIAAFSRQDLRLWKDELIQIFFRMASFKHLNGSGFETIDSQTHNWASCGGKFGHQCEFTQLCEQNFVPVRDMLKKTQYRQKQEWRPW